MAGEGDDADVPWRRAHRTLFAGADVSGRLVAVHDRHLPVHQDQVVQVLLPEGDGLPAVFGQVDPAAERLQHGRGHLLVHPVVLDQQDVCVQRRVTLPAPGGLYAGAVFVLGAHEVQERVVEHRLAHRLREVAGDPRIAGPLSVSPAADRGEHQQLHQLVDGPVAPPDGPGQLEAVHPRHLHVQDDDVVGEQVGGRPDQGERLGPVAGRVALRPPGGDLLLQDVQVGRVVVHRQDPGVLQQGGVAFRRQARQDLLSQLRGEPESRARPRGAGHPHAPPHHAGQLFGDGEPEAGAAVFAGHGAVGL